MAALSWIKRLDLQRSVIYFGFLAIFLFFAATLHDDGFLTTRNLTNIVLQTAPATIMAIGLVFALSAGEIDLSFGSIVAVSASQLPSRCRTARWSSAWSQVSAQVY